MDQELLDTAQNLQTLNHQYESYVKATTFDFRSLVQKEKNLNKPHSRTLKDRVQIFSK